MKQRLELTRCLSSLILIDYSLPTHDQFELSLFGPGVGECAVFQIPGGKWIIIDSFINYKTKIPVAIEYLNSISVDIAKDVVGIVISHWHSDHIKGMSQIIELATSAEIWVSQALTSKELIRIAQAYGSDIPRFDSDKSNMKEFYKVLVNLKNSNRKPKFAKHGHTLYRNNVVTIEALSPSDASYLQSIQSYTELFNKSTTGYLKRLPKMHTNDTSVAVTIALPNIRFLLSSDIETTNKNDTGWDNVFSSTVTPLNNVKINKVAHHGSSTGEHPKVWTDILQQSPISILTQFRNSKIPQQSDINRIIQNSNKTFMTSCITSKPPKRENDVKKMYNSIVTNPIVYKKEVGHIQIRGITENDIVVNLNQFAQELKPGTIL